MADPVLVPTDALRGTVVGISVSESADLVRLGLSPAHCELAVAELARAIFLAGGTVVYGGRLVPAGFTDVLLGELHGYRSDRDALIICVPEAEHRQMSDDELRRRERELHTSADLVLLDADGIPVEARNRSEGAGSSEPYEALSAMRRHITERCHARVVVGGKLRGYQGAMPGVIEEARMSIAASQPLYVAGGFGGAAAAIAAALGRLDNGSAPGDYPEGAQEHERLLGELVDIAGSAAQVDDGLDEPLRKQLAWSHRPGEIASLVVLGLARRQS